jgi:hypothetical protein
VKVFEKQTMASVLKYLPAVRYMGTLLQTSSPNTTLFITTLQRVDFREVWGART